MAAETVSGAPDPLLDRIVTVLDTRCTVRELAGMFIVFGRAHVALWRMLEAALRRRWAAPDLDLRTDQLHPELSNDIQRLFKALCMAVVFAHWTVTGPCLESELGTLMTVFNNLPIGVPPNIVNRFSVRRGLWKSNPLLAILPVELDSVQWTLYKNALVEEAAVLLGTDLDLSDNSVQDLFDCCLQPEVDRFFPTRSWHQFMSSIWERVVKDRVPGATDVVAQVLPVQALPELVVKYMFGEGCLAAPKSSD
jgi:hypothetical protein